MESYNKEKWEQIGLLEGVPEDRKNMAVESMNFAMNWLSHLNDNSDEDISEIETITLPVILRIALQIDLTKAEVLECCKELRQQWSKFDRTRFQGNIDPEAAFCKSFAEMKINQYKNKLL